MTRDDYKTALLDKGFVFLKTQMGYPGRGEEDVYMHPDYQYKFYVTRFDKNNESLYGFYTGEKNGEDLDDICPRNALDSFSDKGLLMWADEAFIKLMEQFSSEATPTEREFSMDDADELITVILPTINNDR